MYLHGLQKEAFITDTIGFIQNLSAELIESFQSTLAETVNADLLLHVIDISDEFYPEKIETVEQVLANLGLQDKPRLFVFNKMDGVSERSKTSVLQYHPEYAEHTPLFISAVSGEGISELIAAIEHTFTQ